MTAIPTLETPRLILRPPVLADWQAFYDFLGSERASFIGGPLNERDAWRAFGHMAGHWTLLGYGLFVAVAKDSGEPVCSVGPWTPKGWPENEIAWSVWSAQAEGKGYAFEAATAARNWIYQTLNWQQPVSYIDVKNTRSAALAQRMGCVIDPNAPRFAEDSENTGDDDYHVWRHPAADADGSPEAYA